jgi:zinc D-Ala-D-Ala dipeptidase
MRQPWGGRAFSGHWYQCVLKVGGVCSFWHIDVTRDLGRCTMTYFSIPFLVLSSSLQNQNPALVCPVQGMNQTSFGQLCQSKTQGGVRAVEPTEASSPCAAAGQKSNLPQTDAKKDSDMDKSQRIQDNKNGLSCQVSQPHGALTQESQSQAGHAQTKDAEPDKVSSQDVRPPEPWSDPRVPQEVIDSVLILPIAHRAIKAIPIADNKEEMIDLATVPAGERSSLRPMSDFDDRYKVQYPGASMVRCGLYEKLKAMVAFLQKENEKDNRFASIGIAYFEGYRPLFQQLKYFVEEFSRQYQKHGEGRKAYQATARNVSPVVGNVPPHTTGGAIDMTLFVVDKDGKESLLDMGKFDVIFGINDQQETFSPNTTQAQRDNRLLLLRAARAAGLINYGFEWWHFEHGTRAYAYLTGNKPAVYNIFLEKDGPILPTNEEGYIHQLVEGVKKAGQAISKVFGDEKKDDQADEKDDGPQE